MNTASRTGIASRSDETTESSEPGFLLHAESDLAQMALDTVRYGRSVGIEHVTANVFESGGTTMVVRNGTNVSAVRDGETKLTVTVYDGGRWGASSTPSFSAAAIRRAVEHARDVANRLEPDEEARPADHAWLTRDDPRIPLFAHCALSPAELNEAALEIENAAREAEASRAGIVTVMQSSAASHDSQSALAISPDFVRSVRTSMQSRGCTTLATSPSGMAQASWGSNERRTEGLLTSRELADIAVQRAARKLGGRSAPSMNAPILFDANVAGALVGALVQALYGRAQERHATFLPNVLGKRVLGHDIDLIEDPFEPYGLRSGGYDSEGIGGSRRHVVRGGVVEGLFLSARSARKLGMAPTGNASGWWNLSLQSRDTIPSDDLKAMLRRLHRGLWITEFLGGQSNGVTGAYSMAVAGFWVEGGELAYPVQDTTVAGDLATMLAGIRAIGADIPRSTATRCGSILIEAMKITGR